VCPSPDDNDRTEVRTRDGRTNAAGSNLNDRAIQAFEAPGNRSCEPSAVYSTAGPLVAQPRPQMTQSDEAGIHGGSTNRRVEPAGGCPDLAAVHVYSQRQGDPAPRPKRLVDRLADVRPCEGIRLDEVHATAGGHSDWRRKRRAKSVLSPPCGQPADERAGHCDAGRDAPSSWRATEPTLRQESDCGGPNNAVAHDPDPVLEAPDGARCFRSKGPVDGARRRPAAREHELDHGDVLAERARPKQTAAEAGPTVTA